MGLLVTAFFLAISPAIIISIIALFIHYHGENDHRSGNRDYGDFETKAARGDRDYFDEDLSKNYNSYYAQIEDAALMGDPDARDELEGDFGEDY